MNANLVEEARAAELQQAALEAAAEAFAEEEMPLVEEYAFD